MLFSDSASAPRLLENAPWEGKGSLWMCFPDWEDSWGSGFSKVSKTEAALGGSCMCPQPSCRSPCWPTEKRERKKGMKRTWEVCFSHVWNGWKSVMQLSLKNCESAVYCATSEEGRPDTSGEGQKATSLEIECRNIPLQTKVLAWVWLESQTFKMVLHLQERWGRCGGAWWFGCWHGDFKLVSVRTPRSSAIVSLRWVGMTLTCVVWGMWVGLRVFSHNWRVLSHTLTTWYYPPPPERLTQ